MKLAQRLVLAFYQNKFKIIEMFSVRKAAEAAFELFCTPYSRRRSYQQPKEFARARKQSFPFQEYTIHGFRWKPETYNGHTILIAHGFDSYSYKFKRYINPLLQLGFEVLAFDAPAHGLSTGKTINALLYSNMILEINRRYGPLYGIIAHSFGGIAASLAIEKLKSVHLKKLVLIAPATETTRSLADFGRYLKISKPVKAEMKKMIEEVEGHSAEWYSVSRAIQNITVPTLWVHDRLDTITPFEDMAHLTELSLPHVQFLITEGLGHSLYNDDDVADKIIDWLKGV